jgi:hypothetical protein
MLANDNIQNMFFFLLNETMGAAAVVLNKTM